MSPSIFQLSVLFLREFCQNPGNSKKKIKVCIIYKNRYKKLLSLLKKL